VADAPEPTTEQLLREGGELLDSSQELLRDLDEQLEESRRTTGTGQA